MLSNKNISLLLGVAVAGVFLTLTPKSWSEIGSVKNRQVVANERLVEWKDAYHALLPVNEKWVKTYPDGRKARDVVSLYRLIGLDRHRLIADIDKVAQSASSEVLVNGVQVGLQRLCVSSDGAVMTVEAASIKDLRSGLMGFSARPDVDMGGVVFSFNSETSKPVAKIENLCLKIRMDSESDGGSVVL